jgi:hypothetical protein
VIVASATAEPLGSRASIDCLSISTFNARRPATNANINGDRRLEIGLDSRPLRFIVLLGNIKI